MTITIGINSSADAWGNPADGGGAAIVAVGKIICALAEERLVRKPHAGGFEHALQALLFDSGLDMSSVEGAFLSTYGHPILAESEEHSKFLSDIGLDCERKLFSVPSHHLSHAHAALHLSPFEEAIVVVADNEGSMLQAVRHDANGNRAAAWHERQTYYWARGNEILLLDRDLDGPGEMGFGRMYGRFTRYIGFDSYHDAGKTMGLAGYANPPSNWPDLWHLDEKERLVSCVRDTRNVWDVVNFLRTAGVTAPEPGKCGSFSDTAYQELASYIQHQLCKWFGRRLVAISQRTGLNRVCLGGGVALNSVLNSYLEESLGFQVFVPPFPSDEGQALGNAIYGYKIINSLESKRTVLRFSDFAYLGPRYSANCYSQAVRWAIDSGVYEMVSTGEPYAKVAGLLADGFSVGWFQGRSEYGARGLGNRSILADPRNVDWKKVLNARKGREVFRPLAPSVLGSLAPSLFEGNTGSILHRYMLGVLKVRNAARNVIPAAVHIDGTARPQIVRKEANGLFYELLTRFFELTGVPALINTSYNFSGESIVESPMDAVRSGVQMALDVLAIGKAVLVRKNDAPAKNN